MSFGQSNKIGGGAKIFNFGAKIGVNTSKLITKFNTDSINNIDQKYLLGYHFGVFGRFNIKGFFIQPEAYLAVKNGKFTYDYTQLNPANPSQSVVNSATQEINFTQVDIPVLIGYGIGMKNYNFRVEAGPVVSFLVKGSYDINKSGVNPTATERPDFNSTNWSVQAGIGIDLWKFTFDARYERGLTNLSSNSSIKHNMSLFIFSLGFKIL